MTAATPTPPALVEISGTFIWRGQKRDVSPLRAGFNWSEARGYWWTRDPAVAALTASRATDAHIDIPIPAGLELMPFQKAGVAYAVRRFEALSLRGEGGGVLIGDDMGLGKTVQAAGIINVLGEALVNVLVVCPASLKINWRRELEKWLTPTRWVNIVAQYFPAGASIRIINYDRLHKFTRELAAVDWDLVIADEAHMLKNPDARRSKSFYGIPARRIAMLTGTPIVNRPLEIYPLANHLAPGAFGDWDTFQRRYHYASLQAISKRGQERSRRVLAELQEQLRSTIMVRRLKGDVLKDLPPKRRQVIELDPEAASAALTAERQEVEAWMREMFGYRLAVELAKGSESDEEYTKAVDALRDALAESKGAISRIRHQTALAKVPAVTAFVREALESSDKIVLFAHHQDVIAAYQESFRAAGAVKLVGGMAIEERQRSVDRFQQDASVKVFIGSIQAAGVGITLTASSHVIFAELDWVPGNMTQAEDRCHRIGQAESVLVQHLVFEDSLDATMAKKIVEKQKVIEQALDLEKGELASAPLIPLEEHHATAGVTRARIIQDAERMTAEQVKATERALTQIKPSNPLDAAMLDELVGRFLTARKAALARRIVRKYAEQVELALVEAVK